LPKLFQIIAKWTKKCLFWVFQPSESINKKVDPNILPQYQPKTDKNQPETSNDSKLAHIDQNQPTATIKTKCNFCKRCDECMIQLDKEKQVKKEQAEFKSNLDALNYLAFIILFLFILCSNTSIWTLMVA
jgi:hypothetical protein